MNLDSWTLACAGLAAGACVGYACARWSRTIPLQVVASALARSPQDVELIAMFTQLAGRPQPTWRTSAVVVTVASAAAAMCWCYRHDAAAAILASGFAMVLVLLAWIDGETHLLPDVLTWPLCGIGLIVNVNGAFAPIDQAALGAIFGYATIWVSAWGFEKVTGQEGIGLGDAKLFGALGAWMGLAPLPGVFLGAAVLALAGMLVRGLGTGVRHEDFRPHPFGPYLAFVAILAMLGR